ncbi:hypothetical protein [Hoeflea prorocentri]|uniref:Flagellar protein FlgN n=1 Tax=Hoeflea prorocentri TaxID=1922333 RepID=A0A9X3UNA9_9HYPH|nr:hypothetical protein [Hoeflea prorocentri]MCY6382369.1 hypothetical protein [Hoeflea prorocentri]MDA5400169.1 hypothetical protein [Hoeflea prorocentri]
MSSLDTDDRVLKVLNRLDAVLDFENTALGTDPDFDVEASNVLKSRCLYELSTLTEAVQPEQMSGRHGEMLVAIRGKLERNTAKVKAHLDAVRKVTDLLRDAAQEAEADGTYTADQFYMREVI